MSALLHRCLILPFILLAAGCAVTPSKNTGAVNDHPAPALSITLLHINDHHSHLDPETLPLQLETAPGTRERILVSMGGFARMASAMKELATRAPNPIKIHAGDAVTGDLYYNLTQGKADADLMNVVCFDAFTLGNHEFDNGDAGLKVFLDYLRQGSCKTWVLSANTHFGPDSALNPARAPGMVEPYAVLERGGCVSSKNNASCRRTTSEKKIGLIGITVADKTKNSSRPDAGTTFSDETATAQSEIDRLAALGIDQIILQTHQGYQADQAMARKLRGVDVIVGGDSHTLLGPASMKQYGMTPRGPYPTMATSADGKPVCIVQAGQYAYVLGELRVDFDAQGNVLNCSGSPHVLIGDTYARADTSRGRLKPKEIESIRADIARSHGLLRPTAEDPGALAVLAPYKARKEAFGSSVVATAANVLCLRRIPGAGKSRFHSTLGDLCNRDPRVQKHGGDVQQLVAEAFLRQGQKYFKADLSIQNGGGVRTDIQKGPVTVKDIYTVLPFKNTLVQLKATGAEIKAALEDALDAALGPAGSTGAYPYSAGLRWTVRANQPKGSRLANLEIRGKDGKYRPFDLGKTWNVATISFLADGHDHYTAFNAITGQRRVDVGLDYAQTLLDYLADLPGTQKILRRLPTSDYSTQQFIE